MDYELGYGNAWRKQVGIPSNRSRKCYPKRTPQGLQGPAKRAWQHVCKSVGKRYRYTLTLCERRYITLKVNGEPVVIFIDHADGSYNYYWERHAITIIRKARK